MERSAHPLHKKGVGGKDTTGMRERRRGSRDPTGLELLALGALGRLGREELRVDVREDTTLRDDDVSEEAVQLLVVADGELEVTRDDTRLLVVTGSVAGELEDLGSEVLENSGEVDGSTGTDTLGVVTAAEETVDTTDGELETGLGRTRLGLGRVAAGLATRLATGRHVCS